MPVICIWTLPKLRRIAARASALREARRGAPDRLVLAASTRQSFLSSRATINRDADSFERSAPAVGQLAIPPRGRVGFRHIGRSGCSACPRVKTGLLSRCPPEIRRNEEEIPNDQIRSHRGDARVAVVLRR